MQELVLLDFFPQNNLSMGVFCFQFYAKMITHISDSACCFALFSYLHWSIGSLTWFQSVFYSKSRLNCSWFPNFEPSFLKIGIDGCIEIIALEKSHSQVSRCSAPVILLFKAEVYWCESLIFVLP